MSPEGETARALVVDDSEVVRLKLRRLIERSPDFEFAGEARDGETGVAMARQLRPDVVVMDLRMPGTSGIEAIWKLGSEAPGSRVLVLTVSTDDDDLADAVMAGALGYVVKGAGDADILEAMGRVAAGERSIPPELAGSLVARARGEEPGPPPAAASAPARERPPAPEQRAPATPEPAEEATRGEEALTAPVLIGLLGGLLVATVAKGPEIAGGGAGSGAWLVVLLCLAAGVAVAVLSVLAARETL